MKNLPILPFSFVFILSLFTICPVNSEEPDLWVPQEFDWDVSYAMVCDAFYGTVYEMPRVEREKGTYTGVMAGRDGEGFIFTFCDDQLVGVCVAYGSSGSRLPSIRDTENEKGYTRTYESRSGNWTYVESGLKGYEVLSWENNLGVTSVLVSK